MPAENDPMTPIRKAVLILKDDSAGTSLVRDVIKRCGEYVSAVTSLEAGCLMCAEGEEYRQQTAELDMRRSQCHDALIDAINISCRYLVRHYPADLPPGGIYPEPSHLLDRNRRAIGDWAGRVVSELFIKRR